ncbi:MAG: PAS domain S-box protein, partial [Deltaproteobacteria bacterium]
MEGLDAEPALVELSNSFEDASVAMALRTADGRVVWANRALRGLLGYTLAEYRVLALEQIVHPADLELLSAETARCLAGQADEFEIPIRLVARDGEAVPVLLHSAALRRRTGGVYGFLTQIVDQRSVQETSARLARQLEYRRVTTELATRFINVPVERLGEAIVEALGIVAGFAMVPRAAVFSFDEEGDRLLHEYEWYAPGLSPLGPNLEPIPAGMFPWWSGPLARGESVVVDDTTCAPGVSAEGRAFFEVYSIGSFLCAPLASNGRRLGLVAFADPRPRGWNEDAVSLLRVCGELISALIERVQRERRIAETSELFARMASSVNEAFWIAEVDPPRVVYLSPASERLLGMPLDRAYRDPSAMLEYIEPEDRLRFTRLFAADGSAPEERELVYRLRRRDGEVRWLRTRVFPLQEKDRSGPFRVTGTTVDVTDEVIAKERLEQRARVDRAVSELAMNFINLPAREIPAAVDRALSVLATLADVDEAYLL